MNKVDRRIEALVQSLAGEKLPQVLEMAELLHFDGKKAERALADALEKHKCLPESVKSEETN